jgi:cell fate regulator YaaT (PSP1 superfamily)
MSCGSGCAACGIADGIPAGCKGNGKCGSGGCNMMNSFNWLADHTSPNLEQDFDCVEVSFKNGAEKSFCKVGDDRTITTGEMVAVSSDVGYDIGRITLSGELVRLQMKKKEVDRDSDQLRQVLRRVTEQDLQRLSDVENKEQQTLIRARAIARQMNLEMKIGDVTYQADNKKVTFYYTAEGRVDFRELIKTYAKEFKVKIKMMQIGSRQEAGRIGGMGDCGRELCCSTWLSSFSSVVTSAARYQNLSINQSKLSGQCGRLKCCLNYELDTYMDALKDFPKKADRIETTISTAVLQKTDIFKQIMWYSNKGESKFYPLTLEQVNKALALNKQGKKAQPLAEVQIEIAPAEVEDDALVGQITLATLEKGKKKKSNKNRTRKKRRKKK